MNTIREFVARKVQVAFELVPLPPQTKMTLFGMRDAYIESQVKIAEGMGCETIDDYITKPLKIDYLVINRCLEEVLSLKTKEDYVFFVQQKMQECWGINLTDEERLAHQLYTEVLMMPFNKMANAHLSKLIG